MDKLKEMHTKAIVKIDKNMALLCFILNLIGSGGGTLIAGFIKGGDDQIRNNLIVFLIQWFLCWLVVPWIWSIYLGWLIFKASGN